MASERFYISGPMTGIPELNAAEFYNAARILSKLGYNYCNPHELDSFDPIPTFENYDEGYFDNLRRDIRELTKCDAILLLRGWEVSYGARLEFVVASELKLTPYRLVVNEGSEIGYELAPVESTHQISMTHLIPSTYW